MITDYSKMSDFEINKLVATALGIDNHFFISESEASFDAEIPPNQRGPIWSTGAYMVLEFKPSNGNCFNPCNNPADAWPIIVDNGISLECIVVNRHEKTWRAQLKPAYVKHRVNHKNPLRAAMVVFLMMQESKNAS